MRMTAVVLGCIGGGLLVVFGLPLAITHPAGLLFVVVGGLGIAGGVTARARRVLPGVLLALAAVVTILVGATLTPLGLIVLFVPSLVLLLATIFAFAAPLPDYPDGPRHIAYAARPYRGR